MLLKLIGKKAEMIIQVNAIFSIKYRKYFDDLVSSQKKKQTKKTPKKHTPP